MRGWAACRRCTRAFAETWPVVRDALPPLTVVVDAANVVGSRPDGWWRTARARPAG